MTSLSALGPIFGATLAAAILAALLVRASGMIRYIGNNRIAIVEKLWSGKGSIQSGIIALNNEAGFEPEALSSS